MIKKRNQGILNTIKSAIKNGLQSIKTFGSSRALLTGERNYLNFQIINPRELANAFSEADQGNLEQQAIFFTQIEQADPHIFAELAKRRRGVAALNWQIKPPKDATQVEVDKCEELTEMINSIKGFRQSLYDLSDAIGKGFSALEIDWQTGEMWLPKKLIWTPQSQFMVDNKTGELMLKPRAGNQGVELEPARWLIHEHKSMSGYLETSPLFRVLAWCYAYKAYNARDLQRFLEVYGLPLRLGKFPEGAGEKTRNDLLRAVSNIGSDTGAIVPATAAIDFIDTKGGKTQDFLDAINYWDKKISVAILGSTLTSQVDSSSNSEALGRIHEEMRLELIDADVAQIAPTITQQLVYPIAQINGMFSEDRLPNFEFDIVEPVDAEKVIKVLETGVNLGMQIPLDWAHQKLQIPKAGKDDQILQNNQSYGGEDKKQTQKLKAILSGVINDDDPMVERLVNEAGAIEDSYIKSLYKLISDAGSLDDAAEEIMNLAKKSELQIPLAKKITDGLLAANLSGRNQSLNKS